MAGTRAWLELGLALLLEARLAHLSVQWCQCSAAQPDGRWQPDAHLHACCWCRCRCTVDLARTFRPRLSTNIRPADITCRIVLALVRCKSWDQATHQGTRVTLRPLRKASLCPPFPSTSSLPTAIACRVALVSKRIPGRVTSIFSSNRTAGRGSCWRDWALAFLGLDNSRSSYKTDNCMPATRRLGNSIASSIGILPNAGLK